MMSSTHSVCLPCRVRTNRVPRCRIHLSAESSHKQVLWGEAEDKEGVHCHHFQPLTTFIWKPVDEQMFYTLLFAYSCYYIGVLFLHVSKQMHINPQHTDLRRLICSYILWSYALHFHTDTHTQCLTNLHRHTLTVMHVIQLMVLQLVWCNWPHPCIQIRHLWSWF